MAGGLTSTIVIGVIERPIAVVTTVVVSIGALSGLSLSACSQDQLSRPFSMPIGTPRAAEVESASLAALPFATYMAIRIPGG